MGMAKKMVKMNDKKIFNSDFLNSCCVVSKRKSLAPVFMVVTKDEYQLPVLVSDTETEFAKALGVKTETAKRYIRDKNKQQYIVVYIEK